MTIQQNYGNIKPSLNLDFANTKQLDPRITYSRASTGTYYDGKTAAKAEENLLVYSQEFDNAAWIKNNLTITANAAVAPDGTSTAETLDEGTATNYHNVTGRTAQVGTNTISVFAKNISAQYVILTLTNGSGTYCSAVYDTVAGTVANSAAAGSGYSISVTSITSVGNGWYRCVMTCVMPSTGEFNIGLSSSTTIGSFGLSSYTGTSRQMFIWGAQLEQRSFATAYTPTTTAPITNYIPVLQTAASGVARFDHNPLNGESLGLLIEEQRTNELTQTAIDATGVLLGANAGGGSAISITRYGGITEIIKTGSGGYAEAIQPQNVGGAIGDSFTYSVSAWVKVVSGDPANVLFGIAQAQSPFNTAAQTLASLGVSQTGVWYKVSSTRTMSTSVSAQLRLGYFAFNVNASVVLQVRELQAERAAFSTSFIPTYASQVTRAADSASMTGTNFSSWYNQSEGSISGTWLNKGLVLGAYPRAYSISDGSDNNAISRIADIQYSVNTMRVSSSAAIQSDINAGAPTNNTVYKFVDAYKSNDFAACVNAGTVGTDTSGVVPTVNRLVLGVSGDNSSNRMNGTISRIAYYPRRLTNTQLQALTS